MNGPDFSRVGFINPRAVTESKRKIEEILLCVEEELTMRGIPESPRPKGVPESLADSDITRMSNNQLANLYTQYVAYGAYLGNELAKIEGLEEGARKLLKDTLAELKDACFSKGLKGPEATAAAMRDEVYKEMDFEHMKLYFMKTILKRRARGYSSQAAALSRNIELRKLEFEQSRRDTNIGLGGKKGGFGALKPRVA